MIKKAVAFVLAVIMAFTMFGTAFADNERTSGLYTYTIKGNGTITITDYDWDNSSGDVYIPSMLDGYTVTAIGDNAFADGKQSVIITIPGTITMIGKMAFANSNITTISIPASVKNIGEGILALCPNLQQVIIDSTNQNYATIDGALYDKSSKKLVAYPLARNVTIPEGIVEIGSYSCAGLALNQVLSDFLPSTVKVIGDYAFQGASIEVRGYDRDNTTGSEWLIIPVIPEGVTSIGEHAFENTNIFLGSDLKNKKYTTMNINVDVLPTTIEKVGEYAFAKSNFIVANGGENPGKTTLGSNYQYNFSSTRIQIPDSNKKYYYFECVKCVLRFTGAISEIPDHFLDSMTIMYKKPAHKDFHGIYIVTDGKINSIGAYAFSNIMRLDDYGKTEYDSKIYLNLALSKASFIGERALAFSSLQSSLTIYADHLTSYSFASVTGTKINLSFSEGTTTIPENLWKNTLSPVSFSNISIPTTITKIGAGSFSNISVKSLDFSTTQITSIPNGTFEGVSTLEEVILPASVITIGDLAFSGTGINGIELPANLSSIGSNAFSKCTNLREIVIPNAVNQIGDGAFERTLVTLIVEENSYAELWAQENGYSYKHDGDNTSLDWLN